MWKEREMPRLPQDAAWSVLRAEWGFELWGLWFQQNLVKRPVQEPWRALCVPL